MTIQKEIPEKVISSREACLSHAEDLLRAANRILKDESLPNIAYHLGVLALEEIGKSVLVVMDYFSSTHQESTWMPKNYYDDHVKKLFWATWGPSFDQGKISSKDLDSLQELSRNIHESRLEASYVDFDANGPLLPSDAIDHQQATNLINLASARLEMEKAHKHGPIDEAKQETLKWFITATSDKEKRNLIFGGKSIKKLSSLSDITQWIDWLKHEFDKADEEAKIAAELELKRKPPKDGGEVKDKWKVKIRLFTNSHSIRPKPLNKWNELDTWIKLFPVGGKNNQILLEITLPDTFTIKNLWWAAWGVARQFVVSLNISTCGCFWWYNPEQISRFYEKIVDLEDKQLGIKLERNPILQLGWKQEVLSDSMLQNTAMCFGLSTARNETMLGQGLGAYLTGMAFLNKNDIHIQFEYNSYEYFCKSLKLGMSHFSEKDDSKSFRNNFEMLLKDHNIPSDEIGKHTTFVEHFESGKEYKDEYKITLSEVGFIKVICDIFYLTNFRNIAKQREKNES